MVPLGEERSGGRLDSLGMFEAASTLGDQIRHAATTASAIDDLPDENGITAVVVAGMGGSGIAGDLAAAICSPLLDVPVIVAKGYDIPQFVGPDTLVFAVSFSGDAEETIDVATHAHKHNARLVVVTSGGELGRLADEWGAPRLPVDGSIPMPRAGIGAVGVPPLVVLERLGLLSGMSAKIAAAADHLDARAQKLMVEGSEAATLARRIGQTMPIVYGGGNIGEVAALRWKVQFNENAKVPAFANRIPELTHNEICGWGQHGDVTRQVFTMLLLRHGFEHPQTSRRFELVADVCDEVVADVHTMVAQGADRLTQLLDLIMLGDFVSLELAVQSGVDPGPVPILDLIKSALRE